MKLQFLTPFLVSISMSVVLGLCAKHHHVQTRNAATFTFSPVLGYLMAACGLFFCVVPFLPGAAGDISEITFFFMFAPFWAGAFLASAYFFRYTVGINERTMLVGAFRRLAIPVDSILSCDVLPSGRGSELIVSLHDGKKVRFSGMLGDLPELRRLINSYRPKRKNGASDA